MSKVSTLLFAIMVVALISASAFAALEIKFVQDKFHPSLPVQLNIKSTKDINLNAITFLPSITTEQAGQTPPPGVLTIRSSPGGSSSFGVDKTSWIFGQTIGSGSGFSSQEPSTCINTKTKQVIGSLQFTDGETSFKFIPNGQTTWTSLYNTADEYGEWDITCAVFIDKPEGTMSDYITYTESQVAPGTGTQIQMKNIPTLYTPKVELTAASYTTETKNKEKLGQATVKFEFTTDTIGIYQVSLVNGSGSKFGDDSKSLWCKSGSDDKFARVYNRDIWVTKVPSSDSKIACEWIYHSISRFDEDEKVELQVSLTSTIISKKDINYQEFTDSIAYFRTDTPLAKKDELRLDIVVFGPKESKTPITKDSAVVLTFSKHVDLTKIDGLASDCGKVRVTIGQVMTVSGFTADDNSLECDLVFKGSNVFDYTTFKGASVTVEIDDKSINELWSNSKTGKFELYTNPTIQNDDTTSTEKDGKVVIKDVYKVENSKNIVIPAENVIIVVGISQPGSVSLSQEDFEKHITCEWNSGDNKDMKLEYDAKTMTWSSTKIASLADGKPEFTLLFTCTRTVTKLVKWGRDLTKYPALSAAILIVPKGNIYTNYAFSTTGKQLTPKDPDNKPSDASTPAEVKQYVSFNKQLATPTNKDFKYDDFQTWGNDFRTTVTDLLNKVHKDDLTFKPIDTMSYSVSDARSSSVIGYVDFEAEQRWETFIDKVVEFKRGNGIGIGIGVSDDAVAVDMSPELRTGFALLQSFEVTWKDGKGPDFKIVEEAFKNNLDVNVSDSVAIPTEVSSTAVPMAVSPRWTTAITKCGAIDGAALFATSKDEKFTEWSTIKSAMIFTTNCAVGESCSINADCVSPVADAVAVCQGSKCVLKPKTVPKWLRDGNNAMMSSALFAIVIAIVAILF